ncbi:MAG: hypothetical protein Q4B26_10600 [Eubacteriales bacterium]|nr:hypothetical protein [Eubacteriales bacterium]
MGYYPIKCVHCMSTITMEERCFKIAPEEIKTQGYMQGSDADIIMDGDIELADAPSRRKKSTKQILYKSLAELRKENVIEKEETLPVTVSRDIWENPEYRKELVNSVVVRDLDVNGKKMSGVMRKFYCPHCHEAIIPLAGKLPMYLISLMGPSSAGKTVYLTILHMLLSGKRYPLPQGFLTFEHLGAVGQEFESFASVIRTQNTLPATTTELQKEPYLLRVSYAADENSTVVNKQCLLGLIDMRGEMLSVQQEDKLMDNNVPQFKEADGFIMMVDPETLEGVYNRLPEQYFGGRNAEGLRRSLSSMREAIMDCITAQIGCINKPSVVALAKQDILRRNYAQLGIPMNQPTIAPNFRPQKGINYYEKYYGPMNMSTRNCITYLSNSFTTFLDTTFKDPYYVSLSALGSEVQIRGNRIDNWMKIRPLRVEEPLIWLLMDLHVIPPFYAPTYLGNEFQAMEAWGTGFAENWYSAMQPQEPENNTGKKKKGLFR